MCTIYISHFFQTSEHIYKNQHNSGLALLQYALFDYAGISFSMNELLENIQTGPCGKPFIKSYPDIHYNISHCKDMVVCAISHTPVGVDIENIRSFRDIIIKKVLTHDEQTFLQNMSIDDYTHQEWFFRFWTLKESRIKHSGLGLSMPLTDFSFYFDLDKTPFAIICSQKDLYFYQNKIDETHILSLCISSLKSSPKLIYL